jgi:hypothetical protein
MIEESIQNVARCRFREIHRPCHFTFPDMYLGNNSSDDHGQYQTSSQFERPDRYVACTGTCCNLAIRPRVYLTGRSQEAGDCMLAECIRTNSAGE